MNYSRLIYRRRSISILAGLLLAPFGLDAAQLCYEGFDYPVGAASLTGLNGGSGWNGVWRTVSGNSGDVVASSLTAGVNSPTGYDARSIANSCFLPNGRRIGRKLDTSLAGPFSAAGYINGSGAIGADGKTLYISFMQQPNGTTSYYEFEFHRGDLGDSGRIAGIGNDQGTNTNVYLRSPTSNATPPSTVHTAIGAANTGVNLYVVRIDFKTGNDDVYVYRNPTSLTEPGSPSLTKLGVSDMSFDGISFSAFNNSRTVSHDEVRFGQAWEDVVVPVNAAPSITLQPKASTTAYAGGGISLTAEASGQPLPTYQWYKGADPISGQTGKTLTLTNLQITDAASYHWTATNTEGSASSNDAVVTVAEPGGLLVYEGFDYVSGAGNLPGKAGGLGWSAPWKSVQGGGGNVVGTSLAAGNSGPNGYDAKSNGGNGFTPNGTRDGRFLDTAVGSRLQAAGFVNGSGNVGADGKTLYLSFLQQTNGTPSYYEFELHKANLDDAGRIGGVGNDTASSIVSLRTGGVKSLIGDGSTGVNLYVVRIDFKAGNDDVYVYQNPVSATEPSTATLVKQAAADMSFNGISLAAFSNGRTAAHDEIRIGQAWSDVVFGTSRRNLVWKGDNTANLWNYAANNWDAGSGTTAFVDGDPVLFDDTGSDTPSINVPGNVSTASITATNATRNYTIGGAGSINSSGALTKSGAGSLTLTGTTSFGSTVVVNGGVLGLSGTTSVGGNLNLNAGTLSASLGGTNTFSGTLFADAGDVTLSGTNHFGGVRTTNGNLTISGPTNITGTGGTNLWFGAFAGTQSSLTINEGANVNISGVFSDNWVMGRDGGSATVVQNGGTVTFNTNGSAAYVGATNSAATNASYTMNGGTLEMSAKRLALAAGPITATLTQTGGTIHTKQLDLGANVSTGTGVYNLTGGTMDLGSSGITSFSTHYQVNLGGGTLDAADNWNSTLAMTLTGTGGGTTFNTPTDRTIKLSGEISGSGALIKTGPGVLNLAWPSNSYSGATTVNGGKLGGYGSGQSAVTLASGTTLAPGNASAGWFDAASLSLAAGSNLEIEINSVLSAADEVFCSGAVNLAGSNLMVVDLGAASLPEGTSFTIVEGGSITGTFAGYPEGTEIAAGPNTYAISYSPTQVTLTLVPATTSAYDTWAAGKGLDGSPGKNPAFDADPEGDGIANGLEWILGGDPLGQDASSLITATRNANGLLLTFKREESSISEVALTVQWTNSLTGTWIDVPITQAGGPAANGVIVTVNEADSPDSVSVEIPSSNGPDGKLFGRLQAIKP